MPPDVTTKRILLNSSTGDNTLSMGWKSKQHHTQIKALEVAQKARGVCQGNGGVKGLVEGMCMCELLRISLFDDVKNQG